MLEAIYISLAFLACFVARAAASTGEIPVVDGVLAGVPNVRPAQIDSGAATVSPNIAPGQLRVVENSGVCETTPGVYQASGYGDISPTKSIWFWYFAARKNAKTAPLTLWFNGGPGSSSMIGLFRIHGPCRISNDSSTLWYNKYSWNNESNILYIDQPVGVGFSRGELTVNSTTSAAVDVWNFLQIWFSDPRFSSLRNRPLAIWGESYAGHYAPTFAAYILSQNAAIASKTITGIPINLRNLGIGNGLTDPERQYPAYITYATSNPYHQLVSNGLIRRATSEWTASGGCYDLLAACNRGGSDALCAQTQEICNVHYGNLYGRYNPYFVPNGSEDPYPPTFETYINTIRSRIGAEGTWLQINYDVYYNFASTGDWVKNSRPYLETVINAGVRTTLYAGDADYVCNYMGMENMLDALNATVTPIWKQQSWSSYRVRGQTTGRFKNAGKLSYLRIYGAGHEAPAYKYGNLDYGEAAFQMFRQSVVSDISLTST